MTKVDAPGPSCVRLTEDNGRIIGTIVKSRINQSYYKAEVVGLVKRPYLRVKYDDGSTNIVHPTSNVSYIVYRPPRIGNKYQVYVPS